VCATSRRRGFRSGAASPGAEESVSRRHGCARAHRMERLFGAQMASASAQLASSPPLLLSLTKIEATIYSHLLPLFSSRTRTHNRTRTQLLLLLLLLPQKPNANANASSVRSTTSSRPPLQPLSSRPLNATEELSTSPKPLIRSKMDVARVLWGRATRAASAAHARLIFRGFLSAVYKRLMSPLHLEQTLDLAAAH
jgi:hypothetical protein